MSDPRKIEVSEEDSRFLEYDRDVKVQLSHSENHSTSLKLSEAEAVDLHRKLGAELERRHPSDCPNHDARCDVCGESDAP